jgi:hypothetical protein
MNASKTKEDKIRKARKDAFTLGEIKGRREERASAIKEFREFLVNQFYGDLNVNYDVLMIDFEKFEKELGGTQNV